MPGTSAGSAVARLAADGPAVSRLVIARDGFENRPPRLAQALERCRTAAGRLPAVQVVQPPGSSRQARHRPPQRPGVVPGLPHGPTAPGAGCLRLVAADRDRVAEILAMEREPTWVR